MNEAEAAIAERYRLLAAELNERQRRMFAATEARTFGYGGIAAAARACGLAENTVRQGLRDLGQEPLGPGRVRRSGAGRKRVEEADPDLLGELLELVEEESRGDPERPLRWTSKSVRRLAAELGGRGRRVGFRTIPRLLREIGYTMQSPRKSKERAQHPDRDAQFEHINAQVSAAIAQGQPAISIDSKKKELVGEFKNGGREWRRKGQPPDVLDHDFPSDALGKAIPFGVYDIAENEGLVSVGINHETAQFTVNSIRAWWQQMGQERYPQATGLTVTADCGGGNGNRLRLWKTELQKLADEIGLAITVCHFPPGTSKWNKIEHRLWSFISVNWRGKPLVSYAVVISLIAATTTTTGLKVYARLDEGDYPKGIQVTDAELAAVNLVGDPFHPEWNYTVNTSSN